MYKNRPKMLRIGLIGTIMLPILCVIGLVLIVLYLREILHERH